MRIVCGLDVHKDSIFLCILSSTGEIIERVFGVFKKNKMKVQVAIARKILVCAWHILGENVPYQDFDNRIETFA